MKKLVISLKTPSEALEEFKEVLKEARRARGKIAPHFEIAFDNKRDFDNFVRNISILIFIQTLKPKSIYELAKMINMDQSNLNKIILFFEEIGAVKIKESKSKGRAIKTPVVEYQKIEFDLAA